MAQLFAFRLLLQSRTRLFNFYLLVSHVINANVDIGRYPEFVGATYDFVMQCTQKFFGGTEIYVLKMIIEN